MKNWQTTNEESETHVNEEVKKLKWMNTKINFCERYINFEKIQQDQEGIWKTFCDARKTKTWKIKIKFYYIFILISNFSYMRMVEFLEFTELR